MLNSALCYWNLRLQPMRVIIACGIFHISWSQRLGLFPGVLFCVLALYSAITSVPPTSHGAVCSSHTWNGAVIELLLLSLCWLLQGEMEICDFRGADPLLTVQVMRSQFDLLISTCSLLWEWPLRKDLSVVLQQWWLLTLIWKSENTEKCKTWEFYVPHLLTLLQSVLVARKTWYFKSLEIFSYVQIWVLCYERSPEYLRSFKEGPIAADFTSLSFHVLVSVFWSSRLPSNRQRKGLNSQSEIRVICL